MVNPYLILQAISLQFLPFLTLEPVLLVVIASIQQVPTLQLLNSMSLVCNQFVIGDCGRLNRDQLSEEYITL